MLDLTGWVATAVFAASYFCKRPVTLRLWQGAAALLWIGYGLAKGAAPVIVANVIVVLLAGFSAWREYQNATAVSAE